MSRFAYQTIHTRIPLDPESLAHVNALHHREDDGDTEAAGEAEEPATAVAERGRLGLGEVVEALGGAAVEEAGAEPCAELIGWSVSDEVF